MSQLWLNLGQNQNIDRRMLKMKRILTSQIMAISIILQLVAGHVIAADRTRAIGVRPDAKTPYMGGEVDIITFPNG